MVAAAYISINPVCQALGCFNININIARDIPKTTRNPPAIFRTLSSKIFADFILLETSKYVPIPKKEILDITWTIGFNSIIIISSPSNYLPNNKIINLKILIPVRKFGAEHYLSGCFIMIITMDFINTRNFFNKAYCPFK